MKLVNNFKKYPIALLLLGSVFFISLFANDESRSNVPDVTCEITSAEVENEVVCINEFANFSVSTDPSECAIEWETEDESGSQSGSVDSSNPKKFKVKWAKPGNKTVTVTCGEDSKDINVKVVELHKVIAWVTTAASPDATTVKGGAVGEGKVQLNGEPSVTVFLDAFTSAAGEVDFPHEPTWQLVSAPAGAGPLANNSGASISYSVTKGGQYKFQVSACGESLMIIINVSDLSLSGPEIMCNQEVSLLEASGGTEPYTFEGKGNIIKLLNASTGQIRAQAVRLTHTVKVTDANGDEAFHEITLTDTKSINTGNPEVIYTGETGQYTVNMYGGVEVEEEKLSWNSVTGQFLNGKKGKTISVKWNTPSVKEQDQLLGVYCHPNGHKPGLNITVDSLNEVTAEDAQHSGRIAKKGQVLEILDHNDAIIKAHTLAGSDFPSSKPTWSGPGNQPDGTIEFTDNSITDQTYTANDGFRTQFIKVDRVQKKSIQILEAEFDFLGMAKKQKADFQKRVANNDGPVQGSTFKVKVPTVKISGTWENDEIDNSPEVGTKLQCSGSVTGIGFIGRLVHPTYSGDFSDPLFTGISAAWEVFIELEGSVDGFADVSKKAGSDIEGNFGITGSLTLKGGIEAVFVATNYELTAGLSISTGVKATGRYSTATEKVETQFSWDGLTGNLELEVMKKVSVNPTKWESIANLGGSVNLIDGASTEWYEIYTFEEPEGL